MNAIEHHAHAGRAVDRRLGQTMHKHVRVRDLACQRRLFDTRLTVVGIPAASPREVPVARALRSIADLKARHIHELRILQIERGPSRKRDP